MLRIVKALPTTLKAPLTAAGLSIILQELHDSQDNEIPMSAFGDEGVVVLKQGDVTEMIKFTAVAHNSDGSATLTVPASGRDILPIYPYTSAATGEDFNAGATAIISNDPYTLWKITEDYTNSVALAGAPDASTTVKGMVEAATLAEVRANTATGGTGAALVVTPDVLVDLPTSDQKAALTGTPGTPSTTNKFVTENVSLTAGETIDGATLPVPVYQNKTDNEFYACDGNDTAKMKFVGFAVSNGTDGAALLVQFTGIVDGFTALDEGEKYYLSDTAGTISTTPGTYEVLVGVAISTTQLLIQKGKRYMAGNFTVSSNASQVITLGFRPSAIRCFGGVVVGGVIAAVSQGYWTNGSGEKGAYVAGAGGNTTANVCNVSGYASLTVTSITDTGFTFSVSYTSQSIYFAWEAEGEV